MMAELIGVWPEVCGAARAAEVDLTRCADHELTKLVAGGDMQALAEMYQRHHRRVYALCLRMTRNVADAEDLTQGVFVHLFHHVGSFRGESQFTTWLHRLTVNHVLMHFRKGNVRRELSEAANADGTVPELVDDVRGARPALALERMVVSDAVARLPPGYRAVFLLHDVEGYAHEEIARTLNCAVGTSKSQLHKARMRLRELLASAPAADETRA